MVVSLFVLGRASNRELHVPNPELLNSLKNYFYGLPLRFVSKRRAVLFAHWEFCGFKIHVFQTGKKMAKFCAQSASMDLFDMI